MSENKKTVKLPAKMITDEDFYRSIQLNYAKDQVLSKAKSEVGKYLADNSHGLNDPSLLQASSLKEFETGALMAQGMPAWISPFVLQLSMDLQRQYKCEKSAQRSLAELAAINLGRIYVVQRHMHQFLEKDAYGDLTVRIIAMLSKEQDRAQRHYLTAIQELELGDRPTYKLNIKTQTANIANNQAIQQVGEQTNVEAK